MILKTSRGKFQNEKNRAPRVAFFSFYAKVANFPTYRIIESLTMLNAQGQIRINMLEGQV